MDHDHDPHTSPCPVCQTLGATTWCDECQAVTRPCRARHNADATPCQGPATAVLIRFADDRDVPGCEHHGARLLASTNGGRVYPGPGDPDGQAAVRVFTAASALPAFAWRDDRPQRAKPVLAIRVSSACPACAVRHVLDVEVRLDVQPPGGWSLAGVQPKRPARENWAYTCTRCGSTGITVPLVPLVDYPLGECGHHIVTSHDPEATGLHEGTHCPGCCPACQAARDAERAARPRA